MALSNRVGLSGLVRYAEMSTSRGTSSRVCRSGATATCASGTGERAPMTAAMARPSRSTASRPAMSMWNGSPAAAATVTASAASSGDTNVSGRSVHAVS